MSVTINDKRYSINRSIISDIEWLLNTIKFSNAFSEYMLKISVNTIMTSDDCPLYRVETDTLKIIENPPFLKYKDVVKNRYNNIIYMFKEIHKNVIEIPDIDIDKVNKTITESFKMENNVFLKNPEFILDNFIYHIDRYNDISNNYNIAINVVKAFEYLSYKIINHIEETVFDVMANDRK
jgi:hypothetical protein